MKIPQGPTTDVLRVGTPVLVVAGILVAATALLATYLILLTYTNPCYGGLDPYIVTRILVIPILVIGLGSFVRLPKAFGTTVIFAGLGLIAVSSGLVVGMHGCFNVA